MPRVFNRLITFKVEGEIYDNSTKAEDILRNYEWSFKDYNDGKDHLFIEAYHNDHRGRIVKITKTPKIEKCRKPDTEYFVM